MTMDLPENEIKMSTFLTDRYAEIIKAMGAHTVEKRPRAAPYDITQYQTSHLCGGAIMGNNPKESALNKYLQSWDVPNLFVQGATAFPQNAGYNPTGTVGAFAFWSATAIRERYLKTPGPLVNAESLSGKFIPDCRAFAASGGLMQAAEMPGHCG
jgi:gluconate 2-dehydrogenase alpha chain